MRKNYLNRFTMLIIAAAIIISALAGCRDMNTEQVDKSKTQLYVASYSGGIGKKWLENLKEQFEAEYAEKSFESGRKGVQVMLKFDKDSFEAAVLVNTVKKSTDEVFFASGDNLDEFLEISALLDISDIVTENLNSKYQENKAIESKLTEQQISHFKRDGKYYALPHINSFLGIVYDVDLFDIKRLFFKENGTEEDRFTNLAGARTAGPDGKKGTYDDGLPSTYDEFFELCDYMKNTHSIDPLSWTGAYMKSYSEFLSKALWADYEGLDSANLHFNAGAIAGKDTTDIITGFKTDKTPIIQQDFKITVNNYSNVAKQSGVYYGLKFWEKIIKESYYSPLSINTSQSHVMAQADFLYSRFRNDKKDIAMMLEGSWWENEANEVGTFNEMTRLYGEEASKNNRRLAFMPMPKQSADKINGKSTLFNYSTGISFVNANIREYKKDLAKAFLQYALTDRALTQFTVDTGFTKALKYDIDDESFEKLSYFTKSLIDMTSVSDIVETYYYSPSIKKAVLKQQEALRGSLSKIDGKVLNTYLNEFRVYGISAESYFNGLYTHLIEDIV